MTWLYGDSQLSDRGISQSGPAYPHLSDPDYLQVQALMTNAERYNLSAAVFTALTDVELEIDGLMSYDRATIKMGAQPLNRIHSQLIEASRAINNGPTGESLKYHLHLKSSMHVSRTTSGMKRYDCVRACKRACNYIHVCIRV